ncbi:MAG TPA: branched-chain amino acid ABC transporter permease [Myxococcales bacterium]|nr:branched-chain amino acid ABC transporter permease [Myxococcales bacterium]
MTWIVATASVLFVVAIPFVGSDYLVGFAFTTFLFVAMAYGWNLISGYTGYLSFGQISFFGVGAYATAILVAKASWAWPFAVVAGMAISAVLAVPLGWAMLRLRGPYFALGMLGLAQVLQTVASAWSSVTNGGEGIYLPPAESLRALYFASAILVVLALLTTWLVDRSAFGLRLRSIGEDEIAAEAMGVDTTRAKLRAFVLASLFPAVAGGLYAFRLSYVDPSSAFPAAYEIQVILMAIFGGAGTVFGPLAGGILLSALGEALWARFAELHLLLFGLIIVIVLRYMPEGLLALLRRRVA